MLLRRLLASLLVLAALVGPSRGNAAGTRPAPPYLVLIVMDGFRPDYLRLAPMHHLRALMAHGMVYDSAWVGQMESETPTGHATIATGVYPRKHGVVGFGWRDPASGAFTYMPTDLRQIKDGALTRQIEAGGVPSISDLVHARNHRDLAISLSGEKYYASATMGTGADYVFYGKDFSGKFRPVVISQNVPPASSHYRSIVGDSSIDLQDPFASALAVQLVQTLRPRVLLLNFPGPDIAGHYYGGMSDPQNMADAVRSTDGAIGRVMNVYKRLGLFHHTLFVVTADHGMAANRHIVPIHAMYRVVADTKVPNLDQEFRITAGSVWLRDPAGAKTVASALAAKRFPDVEGALYRQGNTGFQPEPWTAAHLPAALLRAYTDLADTEAGPTGPDVVLPYSEDTMGLFVKGARRWGSHGGFSWGVQHIPLILEGPGVRHGVSHFPAKLVDIGPTVERLLSLTPPAGVDGVVLADTFSHAPSSWKTAQHAVQASRLTDVKALEQRSAQQSGR